RPARSGSSRRGPAIRPSSRLLSGTRSRYTTAGATCRSTSPRTWSATNWVSSCPRARTGVTPAKTSGRPVADSRAGRKNDGSQSQCSLRTDFAPQGAAGDAAHQGQAAGRSFERAPVHAEEGGPSGGESGAFRRGQRGGEPRYGRRRAVRVGGVRGRRSAPEAHPSPGAGPGGPLRETHEPHYGRAERAPVRRG